MLHTELMALTSFELKKEMATRSAELDDMATDLQRLPLNGSPAEMAAADKLAAELLAGQSTVSKMRRRLLELAPKKAAASVAEPFAYDKAYSGGRHRPG